MEDRQCVSWDHSESSIARVMKPEGQQGERRHWGREQQLERESLKRWAGVFLCLEMNFNPKGKNNCFRSAQTLRTPVQSQSKLFGNDSGLFWHSTAHSTAQEEFRKYSPPFFNYTSSEVNQMGSSMD